MADPTGAKTPPPPKPLPAITPLERPFWEAAREHRLCLQRCTACGTWRFPASPVCADCDSDAFEWAQASGRGTLASWVTFHRLYFASFAGDLPYDVGLVRLDEGPTLPANLAGGDRSALRIGLPLEVVFEDRTPEISIPMFRPIAAATTPPSDAPPT